MAERFLCFFNALKTSVGSVGVFILCIVLGTIAFLVVLFLSIFKNKYTLKKRAWFFMVCSSTVFLQLALNFFGFNSLGYAFLSVAVYLLYCIPVIALKIKEPKIKSDARDFVKFIDHRIKKDCLEKKYNNEHANLQEDFSPKNDSQSFFDDENVKEQNLIESSSAVKLKKAKKERNKEIDFSHVKNVIARLDFYALSTNDKKTVSDLERAIAYAEREGTDEQMRAKINDGLGALLKIMSKHGV